MTGILRDILTHSYEKLPNSSPALQFFVDIWVYIGALNWVDSSDLSEGPINFWAAVAKGLMKRSRRLEKGQA